MLTTRMTSASGLVLATAMVVGCSGVEFRELSPSRIDRQGFQRVVHLPDLGAVTTAQVGDTLIKTHRVDAIPVAKVNAVQQVITDYRKDLRMALTIPPGTLELMATDDSRGSFFESKAGVSLAYDSRSGFVNPEVLKGGLYVPADKGTPSVYWYWPDFKYPVSTSAPGLAFQIGVAQLPPDSPDAFTTELVYSGMAGTTVSILYRESFKNYARPAFNHPLQYANPVGTTIGYKGARFEILEATNTGIKYRVLTHLPGE